MEKSQFGYERAIPEEGRTCVQRYIRISRKLLKYGVAPVHQSHLLCSGWPLYQGVGITECAQGLAPIVTSSLVLHMDLCGTFMLLPFISNV